MICVKPNLLLFVAVFKGWVWLRTVDYAKYREPARQVIRPLLTVPRQVGTNLLAKSN